MKKSEEVLSKLRSTKHLLQDMVKWMEKVSKNTSLRILKILETTYKQQKRTSLLKKWMNGNKMLTNYLTLS